MCAGVQPGDAAPHAGHPQAPFTQIVIVDVGYLQLAAGRGPDGAGHVHDAFVIEIQAGDGVVGARLLGFFFDAQGVAQLVEFHHAVAGRVADMIGEDRGPPVLPHGRFQQLVHAVAEKDVVAQDEAGRRARQKVLGQQEGLSQTVGMGLDDVGEGAAPLAAVAQHGLEERQVLRRGDDGDLPHARQHEHAERIIDHGFVVHRHELLADAQRDGMQARTGAACQDDALASHVSAPHS